jgi:hypothetical protein
MLVRGDEPLVRLFLPNALDAAKKDDGRAVVWLKDPSVIDSARMTEMFGNGESHLAVVLGPGGDTVAWVSRDRIEVDDAAFAFAAAGDAQESGKL